MVAEGKNEGKDAMNDKKKKKKKQSRKKCAYLKKIGNENSRLKMK